MVPPRHPTPLPRDPHWACSLQSPSQRPLRFADAPSQNAEDTGLPQHGQRTGPENARKAKHAVLSDIGSHQIRPSAQLATQQPQGSAPRRFVYEDPVDKNSSSKGRDLVGGALNRGTCGDHQAIVPQIVPATECTNIFLGVEPQTYSRCSRGCQSPSLGVQMRSTHSNSPSSHSKGFPSPCTPTSMPTLQIPHREGLFAETLHFTKDSPSFSESQVLQCI